VPAQTLPFQVPPTQALPAAEATVQVAGLQALPMMSFSPVTSRRVSGSVTWAVPRAPSSVPVAQRLEEALGGRGGRRRHGGGVEVEPSGALADGVDADQRLGRAGEQLLHLVRGQRRACQARPVTGQGSGGAATVGARRRLGASPATSGLVPRRLARLGLIGVPLLLVGTSALFGWWSKPAWQASWSPRSSCGSCWAAV
jgi:hypothetical protein